MGGFLLWFRNIGDLGCSDGLNQSIGLIVDLVGYVAGGSLGFVDHPATLSTTALLFLLLVLSLFAFFLLYSGDISGLWLCYSNLSFNYLYFYFDNVFFGR